ncbi:hypothetical protein [Halovenus sp. HT40]|uniref:hypothetical protein n=1 Tax=Halovenus sp. HT40 TaxID=3126691 RepID=UPI00300F4E1B
MSALTPFGGIVPTVAFVFAVIWAVILVHELGHYYAGRRIVGIPSDDIRLVAPYFPRYVALRDDEEWVAPTELARYRSVYERHDPEREHEQRFAAAGELVQAGIVAPVGTLVGLAVDTDLGLIILSASLLVVFVYAGLDAIATLYRGRPSGDYSILWQSTPRLPILLGLGFASLHVVPLLILT